ncbi:hypothetical protein CCH79_00011910 [Gambusia affinis]|uniref:Dual specificity phosphatase catalytic domain-containing protein n=1 Tax=Gambusia affinis TaxID=33528 RepID=A0A315VMY9_GAMAF|nr:hypothetical protein CCH79_00011910 [Gambusia affinis]
MQNVVIYDATTRSLEEENSRAIDCARELGKSYYRPIQILTGGYRLFSAVYPFLRTEKIFYTIWELENLRLYPLEIIPGLLYMGDLKQSQGSLWNLKIRAIVSISQSTQSDFTESEKEIREILDIPLADKGESDLYSNFETICNFMSSHIDEGSRVLVVSREGISRCSAVVLAFLIHHFRFTLEATEQKGCRARVYWRRKRSGSAGTSRGRGGGGPPFIFLINAGAVGADVKEPRDMKIGPEPHMLQKEEEVDGPPCQTFTLNFPASPRRQDKDLLSALTFPPGRGATPAAGGRLRGPPWMSGSEAFCQRERIRRSKADINSRHVGRSDYHEGKKLIQHRTDQEFQ